MQQSVRRTRAWGAVPGMCLLAMAQVAAAAGDDIQPARVAAHVYVPIAGQSVVDAVVAQHPELKGADLFVPGVEAREAEPALLVGPVEQLKEANAGARGRVRVHCAVPGECLPFYVTAKLPGVLPRVLPDVLPATLPSTAVQAAAPGAVLRAIPHSEADSEVGGLKSGQRVTLMLDSGPLHIRMGATVLQAAAIGDPVRVRALGHPQVFAGQAVSHDLVRGSL